MVLKYRGQSSGEQLKGQQFLSVQGKKNDRVGAGRPKGTDHEQTNQVSKAKQSKLYSGKNWEPRTGFAQGNNELNLYVDGEPSCESQEWTEFELRLEVGRPSKGGRFPAMRREDNADLSATFISQN